MRWRCARAVVFSAATRLTEAEALAREATALADETDSPILRAHARLAGLAPVLTRAGRLDEAAATLKESLAVCEQKGFGLWADRARTRLAALAD